MLGNMLISVSTAPLNAFEKKSDILSRKINKVTPRAITPRVPRPKGLDKKPPNPPPRKDPVFLLALSNTIPITLFALTINYFTSNHTPSEITMLVIPLAATLAAEDPKSIILNFFSEIKPSLDYSRWGQFVQFQAEIFHHF